MESAEAAPRSRGAAAEPEAGERTGDAESGTETKMRNFIRFSRPVAVFPKSKIPARRRAR